MDLRWHSAIGAHGREASPLESFDMLLVIFGAGASYDSAPFLRRILESRDPYERPPLAHELFMPRPKFLEAIRSFPPLSEIVPYLIGPPADGTTESILQ